MRLRHFYGLNHLHFITASTYRRAPLFKANRFRCNFVSVLDSLRRDQAFRLTGYVLMPDHFHLLFWPSPQVTPSEIIRSLKERTAKFILSALRHEPDHPWCAEILQRLALPPTVHDRASHRVWQRRFYDMNIWSEKKRLEKLTYMHNNPVKRRLGASPEKWLWSSFRFYFLGDGSILAMDRVP